MTRKNKKLVKLRKYRDNLLLRISHIERGNKEFQDILSRIRKALHAGDTLRAYALACAGMEEEPDCDEYMKAQHVARELAVVYRYLIVERQYVNEITRALFKQDYLRVRALAEQHLHERINHDKILLSIGNPYTDRLRKEMNDEMVT